MRRITRRGLSMISRLLQSLLFRAFLLIFAILYACAAAAWAQVVEIETWDQATPQTSGLGSAVCIGSDSESGDRIFATARHNFADSSAASVILDGQRYPVTRVRAAIDDDLMLFWCQAPAAEMPVRSDPVPVGSTVEIVGFGPKSQGKSTRISVRQARINGVEMQTGELIAAGEPVIRGDSGGAVVYDGELVGIVNAFVINPRSETMFTPASRVISLAQYCPGGQCRPIVIRRQMQQPMMGIGIPIGPPRSVPIAVPLPKPETVYVPRPTPDPISYQPTDSQIAAAVNAWMIRNSGQLRGPKGDTGQPGQRGSGLDKTHIESTIITWLEANRDAIVGGPPVDLAAIESRISELEKRKLRVILSENSRILKEQVYGPNEPIVLDLKRIRGAPDAR